MEVPKDEFADRIENVRGKMKEHDFEAVIAYSAVRDYYPGNVMYLANYYGVCEEQTMVVITGSDAVLLSDQTWCSGKMKEMSPIAFKTDANLAKATVEVFRSSNIRTGKIGVAGWNIFPAQLYLGVRKDLPRLELEETNILMELRMIKSSNEIALMRESSRITDLAFEEAMNTAEVGKSEYEIIAKGEYVIRSSGAEPSWQHEVGSGSRRTALVGPLPTTKRVEKGEVVLVDMGASYKGYHADVTRMKPIGAVANEFKDAFETQINALDEAIGAIRPGKTVSEVHAAAQKPIKEAGYAKEGGWTSTGHSNGLDEHEWPFLDRKANVELRPGMIFCVEPSFTTERLGSIRTEDMVLVTENGHEILTKFPRKLW